MRIARRAQSCSIYGRRLSVRVMSKVPSRRQATACRFLPRPQTIKRELQVYSDPNEASRQQSHSPPDRMLLSCNKRALGLCRGQWHRRARGCEPPLRDPGCVRCRHRIRRRRAKQFNRHHRPQLRGGVLSPDRLGLRGRTPGRCEQHVTDLSPRQGDRGS